MTVYPLNIDLFGLEVTGYGIMMMVGFLAAGWVMVRELRRRNLNPEYASDIVFAAVIGGIVGAKIWYVVLTQEPGALFSRGGMVWYGGFIGGSLAVLMVGSWRRIPTGFTADLVAPALAAGYALGRLGCFLVGDDYGVPTSLPWGMKFPEGLPATTAANLAGFGVAMPEGTQPWEVLAVHPTQLYEAALMLGAFWLLWRLRAHTHGTGWLFGLYLALAGSERFLIELVRAKDDRLLGTFTVAQATSVALVTIGIIVMARLWNGESIRVNRIEWLKPASARAK
jgi:phosphatidylglycerol---prolipoprotein diacylglyceryl transferase